ncbi:MAG: metallophosphoesterase family protein [Candidatus Helarchaeales archaeon]
MVKIAHVSDSHLGFRLNTGLINRWKEENKLAWYEDKIYQAWSEIIEAIIERKDEIACVIHSGDFFHTPFKGNSMPPLENARTIAMKTLQEFFERTNNKIPFILIDGNHGVYGRYLFSPMDPMKEVFPNFHFFSVHDLRKAIRENTKLSFKIESEKLCINLFPYFEFNILTEFSGAYKKWVSEVQIPERGYLNVAVVHGMELDQTLEPKILQQEYDYIALGHNHKRENVSKNAHNPGAIFPLTFKDKDLKCGFSFVEISRGETPKIIPWLKKPNVVFSEIPMEISLKETSQEVLARVKERLEMFKGTWDGNTAARVKIRFLGNLKLDYYWKVQEELDFFKSQIDTELNYNILQLLWDWQDLRTEMEHDIAPGTIIDYILEDPKKEFIEYVRDKIDDKDVDLDLLSEIAVESIEHALREG